MRNKASIGLAIAFLVILTAARECMAQRLLALTTTLSADRAPCRLVLQSVDLSTGTVLPFPFVPTGTQMPTLPLIAADGALALVSHTDSPPNTGLEPSCSRSYFSVYESAPLRPLARTSLPDGWRLADWCMLGAETAVLAMAHETVHAGQVRQEGRLQVWRVDAGPPSRVTESEDIALPGVPVAMCPLLGSGRIAVLCRRPDGTGDLVCVASVAESAGSLRCVPLVQAATMEKAAAVSAVASRDERVLFVLQSGHATDRPAGESSTWVTALDTSSLEAAGERLAVPGKAEGRSACAVGESACWIATESVETGFAYVTRVEGGGGPLAKEAQISLTGAGAPPVLSADPLADRLAVACDKTLEIWSGKERGKGVHRFSAAVGVLQWSNEGLLAGEAGRIHLIDPVSVEPLCSMQLQTGCLTALAVVPQTVLKTPDTDADGLSDNEETERGLSPANPDTDGDGIPDGIDPEPLSPSPALVVPDSISFRGESAGLAVAGFVLDTPQMPGRSWNIMVDRAAAPWVVVHPLSGATPGVAYVGVDPQRYAPGEAVEALLTVSMEGASPGVAAFGSPATLTVRVLPEERADVRRVLWLLADADSARGKFCALAGQLARPPLLFAQRRGIGSVGEILSGYCVVVVDVESISRGAVTRQQALEYVAQGGGLLIVGRYAPSLNGEVTGPWLEPFGITLNTAMRCQGTCEATPQRPLSRHWTLANVEDACVLRTRSPRGVLVSTTEGQETVLAAWSQGLGRIAVLAGAQPLRDKHVASDEGRAFAGDLFSWLADPMSEGVRQDLDGDRLTDDVEDRNGNNMVDPGETDFLTPDTDGDGIPDGVEDANLNGRLDAGETEPLNPDTDGDGIRDGADEEPLTAAAPK